MRFGFIVTDGDRGERRGRRVCLGILWYVVGLLLVNVLINSDHHVEVLVIIYIHVAVMVML